MLNKMSTILKNKLYRFNIWLDKNELLKFIFGISYIFIAMLNLFLGILSISGLSISGLIIFILMISMISIFAILRSSNKIEFDRSIYNVPNVGETIVIKKDFVIKNNIYQNSYQLKFTKGSELTIYSVEKIDGDWLIYLTDSRQSIGTKCINYFETKKYWDTRANIRNKSLSKIGIK